ncbi:hypothetical protein BC938DRAFT_474746, partial [Jimgerdemannia flammicorona]
MIEIISDIRETIETDEAGIPKAITSSRDRTEDADDDMDYDNALAASPVAKRIRMNLERVELEEQDVEDAVEKTLVQLKCLIICRCMLERSEE